MATQDVYTNPSISGGPDDEDDSMDMPQPEAQSTEPVSLALPKSMAGLKAGEKKEATCTIEASGDGMGMITAIDGVKLGESAEKPKEDKMDKYKNAKGKNAGDRFNEYFRPQPKPMRMS